MKLSIITVNYRSFGYLEKALLALAADFPADWEMIVVDNESVEAELAQFSARFPWVRFVANPANSGFGHACNLGAREAGGDRFLFMNPDVIADVESLKRLCERQDKLAVGIIAPAQVSASGKPQKVADSFPRLWNLSKTVKALLRQAWPARYGNARPASDGLLDCDWVTGAVLMIRRSDFEALGGWTEDYWMYVEDADLCRKARDQGLRVACAPDVEVVHSHGGSSRLNVAVKAMTKSEVIISKHVYVNRHLRGLERWLAQGLIVLLRMPALLLATLLNIITLGRVPALRVRTSMFAALLSYYWGVLRTGSWLSPRAVVNRNHKGTT